MHRSGMDKDEMDSDSIFAMAPVWADRGENIDAGYDDD